LEFATLGDESMALDHKESGLHHSDALGLMAGAAQVEITPRAGTHLAGSGAGHQNAAYCSWGVVNSP